MCNMYISMSVYLQIDRGRYGKDAVCRYYYFQPGHCLGLMCLPPRELYITLSHLRKRNIIFKSALGGDMLVSRRVFKFVPVASQIFSWPSHKAPSNVNQVHVYEFRKRSIPKAAKCSQIASASFVMGLSIFYPADILHGTNISRTTTSWHF